MSDCPHDQGQHYLGDCGDMLDYIAIPTTVATAIGQGVINTMADALQVTPVPCPTLGPVVVSLR